MQHPTMGAATMGGAPSDPPPPPVPVPPSGLYAAVGPLLGLLVAVARSETVRIVEKVEVRAKPNLPPTQSFETPTDVVAYVTGPNPVRAGDGSMTELSAIRVWARFADVPAPPKVDDFIEFEEERYSIRAVKRLPSSGPGIAWKIEAVRGR